MQCRTELVKDWTYQELKQEILIWQNVELGTTQFYKWLPYALIAKKRIYTNRDRRKLLKFAQLMQRYKRLEIAKNKLIQHIEQHPEQYSHD
ncbi:MAG: hypothetical protein KME15_26970 [Drouetiella hepatica Uher 2000/2452]|jgi:hypothetical protein|uniref:Uncharacterized protein n=1 Tax=Drouetiella hepatica Uher 2000/2452 TaxID=904376 RepID=A0A951QFV6_9CYAN|nr:hypothetical protein [Drouetiella hepatica Uher 2000/2452]